MDIDPIKELSILYEITAIPSQIRDQAKLVSVALDKATRLLGNEAAIFYSYVEKDDTFVMHSSLGVSYGIPVTLPRTAMGDAFNQAMANDEILIWHPETPDNIHPILTAPYRVKHALFAPVKTSEGLFGLLYIARFRPIAFHQSHLIMVHYLVSRMAVSLENLMMYLNREETRRELEKERDKLRLLNEKLKKRNAQIWQKNIKLRLVSRTDDLTKLYNRRGIFECIEQEKENLKKETEVSDSQVSATVEILSFADNNDRRAKTVPPRTFVLAMVDVDHFKAINDLHGHLCGDTVLKTIGDLLLRDGILRKDDIAGRFGGEEFILLFPSAAISEACVPIFRFYEAVKSKQFSGKNDQVFQVTVSIGISQYLESDSSLEELIQRVDRAMYYAKEHGRDQVIVHLDDQFYRLNPGVQQLEAVKN